MEQATLTVEEVQIRIKELELEKDKSRLEYRFEWSEEYLQALIDVNKSLLEKLLSKRH